MCLLILSPKSVCRLPGIPVFYISKQIHTQAWKLRHLVIGSKFTEGILSQGQHSSTSIMWVYITFGSHGMYYLSRQGVYASRVLCLAQLYHQIKTCMHGVVQDIASDILHRGFTSWYSPTTWKRGHLWASVRYMIYRWIILTSIISSTIYPSQVRPPLFHVDYITIERETEWNQQAPMRWRKGIRKIGETRREKSTM